MNEKRWRGMRSMSMTSTTANMARLAKLAIALPMAAMLLIASACTTPPKPMTNVQDQTLYQRLGGKPAIDAVVGDAVDNVAADARINQRFAHADIPRLKKNLADLVCLRTGGPCAYTGRNMADSHDHEFIRDDEFDALVEDLVKSLNKYKVPNPEQGQLLAILGQMRNSIVGH
jgi:hemoglobin